MKNHINEQIQKYLNTMIGEMTFSEAQEGAKQEILSHIEEHVATGMSYGLSNEEAIHDALKRMGSPNEIGQSLNQIHRPRFDFILPLLALALTMVGLWNLYGGGFMGLQTAWITLGLVLMTSLYFLPMRKFRNIVASLYGVAIVGLIAAYFSGVTADGQPYLSLAGLNIKIVDMAGSLFALGFAALGLRIKGSRWATLSLIALFLVPLAYFSFNGFIWSGMLFLVSGLCFLGMQNISTASLIGTGIVGAGMLILRVSASLVSVEAVGKAIVENAHTDYAMRSLGTAFAMEILAGSLLVASILYGVRLALGIKDAGLRSLAVVGMCLLAVQIFTSVLANVGLLPMIAAGVNVPFVSYGGSGIIANFLILGIVVACYKRKSLVFSE